jgi:inorganic pyrophosphatase
VDDPVYDGFASIADVPGALVDRLRHYFLTYKELPGATTPPRCEIDAVYDVDAAHAVIRAAIADYTAGFPATA